MGVRVIRSWSGRMLIKPAEFCEIMYIVEDGQTHVFQTKELTFSPWPDAELNKHVWEPEIVL